MSTLSNVLTLIAGPYVIYRLILFAAWVKGLGTENNQ